MVTDEQVIGLRALLKYGAPLRDAANVTEMNESTARRYARLFALPSESRKAHGWNTRPDPFAEIWCELAKELCANPTIPVTVLFNRLMDTFPDRFLPNQLRTLQRRVVRWKQEQCRQESNGEDACPRLKTHGGNVTSFDWMRSVLQNERSVDEPGGKLRAFPDLPRLLEYMRAGCLKDRNKALTIVALQHDVRKRAIAKFWVCQKRPFPVTRNLTLFMACPSCLRRQRMSRRRLTNHAMWTR